MGTLNESLQKSDEAWYEEQFNRHECKKLSETKRVEIIEKSMACAEEVYERFVSDIELIGIDGMINRYGTEVQYNDKNDSDRLIAMYDRKQNVLIIFNHSINTLHERIQKVGLENRLDKDTLRDLITAHELYHIIEMNEEDIYTYSKMHESSFLGFTRQGRIATASEIGAFHFSKRVTGIDFSPCIIGSLHEIGEN